MKRSQLRRGSHQGSMPKKLASPEGFAGFGLEANMVDISWRLAEAVER